MNDNQDNLIKDIKESECYCRDCGLIIKKEAEICVHCGIRQKSSHKSYLDDVKKLRSLIIGLIAISGSVVFFMILFWLIDEIF